ncbi:hypothetical protein DFH09DRAFT_1367237 [Mycena vulgaris]|nr:hypothetical protein DFH09DRAFT_1367237 [Mycena vulgaris]
MRVAYGHEGVLHILTVRLRPYEPSIQLFLCFVSLHRNPFSTSPAPAPTPSFSLLAHDSVFLRLSHPHARPTLTLSFRPSNPSPILLRRDHDARHSALLYALLPPNHAFDDPRPPQTVPPIPREAPWMPHAFPSRALLIDRACDALRENGCARLPFPPADVPLCARAPLHALLPLNGASAGRAKSCSRRARVPACPLTWQIRPPRERGLRPPRRPYRRTRAPPLWTALRPRARCFCAVCARSCPPSAAPRLLPRGPGALSRRRRTMDPGLPLTSHLLSVPRENGSSRTHVARKTEMIRSFTVAPFPLLFSPFLHPLGFSPDFFSLFNLDM